jgi:integrase/recombinase XerD
MSEKPISPLRQRMIEDMMVRNFIEKTRNDYIRHVLSLAAFLRRSPDTATPEDLRRFQLHQTQTGVRPPSINASVAGIRFFFTVTLDRPDMARHLTFVREPRKIPAVLSSEEVVHLLEAAPGPKYKAALGVAYGAGLRVSEVVSLKVADVDSKRMLLKVEQGKSLPRRRPGAARIALRCCRRSCSSCYATGTASHGRRSGCFLARTRPIICHSANSTAPCTWPPAWPGSASA